VLTNVYSVLWYEASSTASFLNAHLRSAPYNAHDTYHNHSQHTHYTALLRQTNPLWVAYFFVTDTNPFDDRLLEILDKYQDPRLVYTPIPKKYKIPVSLCVEWVECVFVGLCGVLVW